MIDLDERLRRDAANWHDDAPPSLDDLLDEITTNNRRPRGWLIAAVAAAVAIAIATVVTVWPRTGNQGAANRPQPTPPFTFVPVAHVHFAGVIEDSRDPSAASAVVIGATCAPLKDLRVRQLDETPKSVRIVLSGLGVDDRINTGGCMPKFYVVPVQLGGPIGDRLVYDGRVWRPLFNPSRTPVPGYLPPGYHPVTIRHPAIGQSWEVQRGYGDNRSHFLNFTYAITATMFTEIEHTGRPIEINGHKAWFSQSSSHCLAWSPGRGLIASICGNDWLPNSEVVKVARSLH